MTHPILVTVAGRADSVGGLVGEALQRRGPPVRALVWREHERAESLREAGAEVVGDLTRPADVSVPWRAAGGWTSARLRNSLCERGKTLG